MGKRINFSKWLLLCLLTVLLTGCAQKQDRSYTVRFVVAGEEAASRTVDHGECPAAFAPELTGGQLAFWQDAQGQSVDPAQTAVTGDVTYTAVVYPQLTAHVPYLAVEEAGLLRPDEALTADELAFALKALSTEGALRYFPELPQGQEPVDSQQLGEILCSFYNAETVSGLLPQTQTVTRAQFAGMLHSLLGWQEAGVVLAEGAVLPSDVNRERGDAAVLLEASVAHTHSQEGVDWLSLDLTTAREPGFVNIDGWLYYVEDDRTFLRNGDVGTLHFGSDGRYTSGDEELDGLVAGYLGQIAQENPEASRLELLRVAYDHCHLDFQYLRRDIYVVGQTGWEIEDAKEMITTGRGNCYNFAAAFWAYARGLGYEARAVSGTCTDTDQPHGWVIINIDGADHFFDPEWQYAYRDRGDKGFDMFMIPMERIYYWSYKWKK